MTEKRSVTSLIEQMEQQPGILQLDEYRQHGRHSVLDHSKNVARFSCVLNRKLHLKADEPCMVRGAMLHDYFLYDWHDGKPERRIHGFTHAEEARRNAVREFDINQHEQEMIRSHMWPLNITKIPRSREAWLICMADKAAALYEVFSK